MRICFIVTYSYHYLPCFIGIPIVPTAWSSGFRWPGPPFVINAKISCAALLCEEDL